MIMMNTFLIEAAGVLACKNLAYAVHCVPCVLCVHCVLCTLCTLCTVYRHTFQKVGRTGKRHTHCLA